MSASPPNRSANIGDWELMMGGQWSNSTDLPPAENNFCKDRHVWRQNGWHKWVVLAFIVRPAPPCCCKGFPHWPPINRKLFSKTWFQGQIDWHTWVLIPFQIGLEKKLWVFMLVLWKELMFKVQFVCGLFTIFKKKTKTKRQTKEEDKGKLT